MVDGSRVKKLYRPRVQIPVDMVFDQAGEFAWYCLPKDGVSILRKVLEYGLRRITYIEEIITDTQFLTPDDATMEQIRELVERTEIGLMSECGTDELNSTLELINATLGLMKECICDVAYWAGKQTERLPNLDGYVDQGNVTYANADDAQGEPGPIATDAARCAIAQAHYWYVYSAFTEDILPFAESSVDKLTSAIVATATFAGLASWVGMPVAVLTSIVSVVINWAVDGSIEEFVNWLFASKDEIICEIYEGLPDYDVASANVAAYIDVAGEPSYLDKQVLKTMMASAWHMRFVAEDQQDNGTWDEYIESDACDECDVPTPEGCVSFLPCNLDDWDGGTVSCSGTRPNITGGTSTYEGGGIAIPLNATLRLVWIARGTGDNQGACNVSVVRQSDQQSVLVGNTGLQDFDEIITSDLIVPSWFSAGEAYIKLQQANYTIEPLYWCIIEP